MEHAFRQPGRIASLWAGLLLPPFAWALQMAISYAAVPWLCRLGASRALLVAVPVGGLAVALAGLFVAYRNWRAAGSGWRATGKSAVDRARFMSLAGLLLGGYVSAIIVLQLGLTLGLDVCE
jgi:hypothetical protein